MKFTLKPGDRGQVGRFWLVLLIAIATIAAVGGYSVASGLVSQSTQCPQSAAPRGSAPIQGYQYFAVYHLANGSIISVITESTCQLAGLPPQLPIEVKGQEALLNATSSSVLPLMMPNGYLNAFYVNLKTQQLTIVPGVTFTDPYHAFYNGNPITNGTKIAIPSQ